MPISDLLSPRSAFGVLRSLYRGVAPTGAPPRALLSLWGAFSARLMPAASASRRHPASTVALAGLLTSRDGLGAAARMLDAELRQSGIGVSPIDLAATLRHGRDETLYAGDASPKAPEAIIYHANPPLLVAALPHIEHRHLSRMRSIGYWVWETERAPSEWRTPLRFIDEIWAPSHFAADAIRKIAPQHTVSVVPHAVALAMNTNDSDAHRQKARAALGVGAQTFVVLTSFSMRSCMARKNPLASLAAFNAAFKRQDDALLIIRVRDGAAYPRGLQELQNAVADTGHAPVRVLVDEPAPTLPELYAGCDAYISLHRSEGFGLNLAEAMLYGRPAIASAWSGNLDFMDADCAAMISGRKVAIDDPQRLYTTRNQNWFDASVEEAAFALRKLADDAAHRSTLARAGRERVQALLSGGNAARLLRQP